MLVHVELLEPEQQFLLQQLVPQQGEGPQQLDEQQFDAASAGLAKKDITPALPDATATSP